MRERQWAQRSWSANNTGSMRLVSAVHDFGRWLNQSPFRPRTDVSFPRVPQFNEYNGKEASASRVSFWLFIVSLDGVQQVVSSPVEVIKQPTRITPTGATLLDLVITNCPGFFVNSGTLNPPSPSNSDHSIVFVNLNISISKRKCYTRTVWDYRNVNTDSLNAALTKYD